MEYNEKQINLKLVVVLSKLTKSMESYFHPRFKEMGLTQTQFTTMEALYHKGPMTVNQIIERAHSSSGNMAIVIENLIKGGKLKKKTCPKDRRVRYIELTETGRAIMDQFFPGHVESINYGFSSLEKGEKEQLVGLLKKLGKGISD